MVSYISREPDERINATTLAKTAFLFDRLTTHGPVYRSTICFLELAIDAAQSMMRAFGKSPLLSRWRKRNHTQREDLPRR